jgi:phosphatidylglycerol---prolipoprotein diacylglyceryl transferase
MYGVEPVLVETGWVRLWWYGLAYAVGLLTVDLWVWLRRERLGYEPGDVVLFSVLFAAGVLLGGRIFDVALYEWFYYEDHVRQIPRLWQGGMATHGVLLGAVAGTLLFCRLRGRSFLAVADEVVLPGAVLMALGRLGNHVNGEVYGSITSVPWAMEFPYAEGCRHPVALYDGLKNLLLVPILLGVRSLSLRRNGYLPKGLMLGHFVLWYGLLRLFVDVFREYDSYWLGIGRGQYFNLFMAAAGLRRTRRAQALEVGGVDGTSRFPDANPGVLGREGRVLRSGGALPHHTERVDPAGPRGIRGAEGCGVRNGYGMRRLTRELSLVETRLLLLALDGRLDHAGVREGHALQIVLATGVVHDDEGAVDHPPYPNRRDVPDAQRLDVLSLPPAAQLHPVGVDDDHVVAVRRRLGYRWFQTCSVLFVPVPSSSIATRKNPGDSFPGAFRLEHRPGLRADAVAACATPCRRPASPPGSVPWCCRSRSGGPWRPGRGNRKPRARGCPGRRAPDPASPGCRWWP